MNIKDIIKAKEKLKRQGYNGALIIMSSRGVGKSIVASYLDAFKTFIKDGVCYNDGKIPCNLGYACDGCPYHKPRMRKEKVIFT